MARAGSLGGRMDQANRAQQFAPEITERLPTRPGNNGLHSEEDPALMPVWDGSGTSRRAIKKTYKMNTKPPNKIKKPPQWFIKQSFSSKMRKPEVEQPNPLKTGNEMRMMDPPAPLHLCII
ncbi:hypothetical protein llap_2321 [Limosa lapponica baueri]|uniref:Uncharacterized protein n=1 Tax=Limosa lapponica baueri TaxID=1758121 RepID=A0A2I0UMT1_LIMLA|nr:hypothetical protein llap_2321 [Limosa lapponica baueri]